jgi:hypothetical protein
VPIAGVPRADSGGDGARRDADLGDPRDP